MERDFKGVWIPKDIWFNKGLTITEKVLLVEIDSLSKNGECFASNEHFADFLDMHKNNVSRMISKLIEKGFLQKTIFYKKGTKIVEKRILKVITSVETRQYQNDSTQYQNDSTQYQNDIDQYQNDIDQYQNVKDSSFINNTTNNTTNNTIKNNKKGDSIELHNEFESLWKLYPRKMGNKKKARESYLKAVKKGEATYEQVKNGIEMYIKYNQYHNVSEEFIKHGSTWFNQECWNNDYTCKPKVIQGKRNGFLGLLSNEEEMQQLNVIDFERTIINGEARSEEVFSHASSALPLRF